jgi:hypothetical protein
LQCIIVCGDAANEYLCGPPIVDAARATISIYGDKAATRSSLRRSDTKKMPVSISHGVSRTSQSGPFAIKRALFRVHQMFDGFRRGAGYAGPIEQSGSLLEGGGQMLRIG